MHSGGLLIATIAGDAQRTAARMGAGLELNALCLPAALGAEEGEADRLLRAQMDGVPGGRCIVHGPYAEVFPCAIDPGARCLAMERLRSAQRAARRNGIRRMVAHAGFIPHVYAPAWFVPQSAAFWRAFLEETPDDFEVLLENVLEPAPALVLDVVTAVDDPRLRACLDIGHAHCRSEVPLTDWVRALAPVLGHAHLHNNDGREDLHAPLDQGTLPVQAVLAALAQAAPGISYTLETEEAAPAVRLLQAWGYLRADGEDPAPGAAGWAEADAPPKAVQGGITPAGLVPAEAVRVENAQAEATCFDEAMAPQQASGENATESEADPAAALLRRVFGYDAFRPGQREIIDAQLAGRDALGVMPTGSGKSICFQLPALLHSGVTLVISPLVSLMKDQVFALKEAGVAAAYLNSSLTEGQMASALRRAAEGAYRIIYVAPERLLTPRFQALVRQVPVSLVAVDEAHCISQWGQDFRPCYLDIPRFLQRLAARPPVSAFTATATDQVRGDIVRLLGLVDPVRVETGFDRPNLYFSVKRGGRKRDLLRALLEKHRDESGIIYCATRKNVESLCSLLVSWGIAATRYHAGLSDLERRQNQEDFTFDRRAVIVATNAFGMGIDKSNVRFIVHYNMPGDLESYYQEAGRAGRDGEPAECVLLFSEADVATQRYLLSSGEENEALSPAERARVRAGAVDRLERMAEYCRTDGCLRQSILRYFGEPDAGPCGHCGNCAQLARPSTDVSGVALPILRAVQETGERFGMGTIADMLRGKENARISGFGLARRRSFGALAGQDAGHIRAIASQLVAEGYLAVQSGQYPTVLLTGKGRAALGGEPVLLRMPEAAPQAAPRPARGRKGGGAPAATAALLGEDDTVLFARLRELRMELAQARGVPAFVILTDAALHDICLRRPHTRAEMLRVKGVGESKLEAFGDAFLAAVRAHEEA